MAVAGWTRSILSVTLLSMACLPGAWMAWDMAMDTTTPCPHTTALPMPGMTQHMVSRHMVTIIVIVQTPASGPGVQWQHVSEQTQTSSPVQETTFQSLTSPVFSQLLSQISEKLGDLKHNHIAGVDKHKQPSHISFLSQSNIKYLLQSCNHQ